MDERPDDLASLLATIEQERDPYRSTRVARALRRVAVRDLDERVASALLLAGDDMHNARPGVDARARRAPAARLVVLADALAELRSDGRSLCLAGCARIVAGRFDSARSMLGAELERQRSEPLRGWLSLNLGAASERLGRATDALAAYSACGARGAHPSSVAAAAFALFVALRTGTVACTERALRALLERDPSSLHLGLSGLRVHYGARLARAGYDPLAALRSSLVGLGAGARYVERELRLTSSVAGRWDRHGQSGPQGNRARPRTRRCPRQGTGAGGVPTHRVYE